MSIKVKTILDEIEGRNITGTWEFRDGDGFTRYLAEDYQISGRLNPKEPESTTDSVHIIYQGNSDNTRLSNALRRRLAIIKKVELTKQTYGDFEATARTDEEFPDLLTRLENAETEYRTIIEELAEGLIEEFSNHH